VIVVEAVALTVNDPLGAGVAVGLGFGVALGLGPLSVTVNCAYEAPAQAPIASMIISDLHNNSFLRKFITFLLSMVVGDRRLTPITPLGCVMQLPGAAFFFEGWQTLDNRTMPGRRGELTEKRIQ
jgi:hypothetical protein